MIAGHAHPEVIQAVQSMAANGLGFGAPTEIETQMADTLCRLVPSMDMVRMVNSGTEATMSAIRLARGFTGRDRIVKFEGCYHGHSDALLVKAGSGTLTLGVPTSPGVPAAVAAHTSTLTYNDLDATEQAFESIGNETAAIIVEPVAGNMNCIPPEPGFLEGLRALCDRYGCVLIFDEVMTGFRVARGGAQAHYGVTPDLTTLGKVIGGGLPVGAFGGRRDIMEQIAPLGPVYQAGTLSGNPLAMAAGLALVKELRKPGFYDALEEKSEWFAEGLQRIADNAAFPTTLNRIGSMMTCFFTEGPVRDFTSAMKADTEKYGQHYRQMLTGGIWLAPSQFEAAFVSAAHERSQLEKALNMTEWSFKKIANQ
jgi:glutamate-1-semialdehyde 2,1-aminomutase